MKSLQTIPFRVERAVQSATQARYTAWFPPRIVDRPVGGVLKRSIDIAGSIVILVLLSPLIAGLAALIHVTSRGGVFYGHWRVGHRNVPFRCFKLRTMVANGDEVLEKHFQENPEARVEWEETQKLRDDPRVTPLGQVLRKLSLDELPQFWNVLKGDMSLVGPRPVPLDELTRYGRSARFYLSARPGITGLWQVSGRSNTTYLRRIAYDRVYVSKHSPGKDFMILAQTLPATVRSSETA